MKEYLVSEPIIQITSVNLTPLRLSAVRRASHLGIKELG